MAGRLVLTLACVSYLAAGAISSWLNSPTFDEPGHLAGGMAIWRDDRFDVYTVNPPLLRLVAGASAAWLSNDLGSEYNVWEDNASRPEFRLGENLIRSNSGSVRVIFAVARCSCLIFPLLMVIVCAHWSESLSGHSAGRLAAILCVLSPMTLGHGSLVSPDVAAAATGCLAIYRFRAWCHSSTLTNAFILGCTTGLALLSKFTWIPIFPITALLIVPLWRGHDILSWRVLRRDLSHLMFATVISLFVLNACFGFDQSFTKLGEIELGSDILRSRSVDEVADRKISSSNRFTGTLMGGVRLPLPLDYLKGIDLQMQSFGRGKSNPSYLMGEWKESGWWYYYLIAVLVKEPATTLILGVVAGLVTLCSICTPSRMSFLQPVADQITEAQARDTGSRGPSLHASQWPKLRETVLLLTPAVLVFCLVSSETGFNRHLRYVFPCYPFAFIFISRVAIVGGRITAFRWGVRGLVVWQFVSVLTHGASWISYFNEFAGGSKDGHKWLLSSNIDWGQDFYRLQAWQTKHREASPMFLVAETSYDPADLGLEYRMPPVFIQGFPEHLDLDGLRGPVAGWYAVSLTNYVRWNSEHLFKSLKKENATHFSYLRRFAITERVGDAILMISISDAEASRVMHDLLAEEHAAEFNGSTVDEEL